MNLPKKIIPQISAVIIIIIMLLLAIYLGQKQNEQSKNEVMPALSDEFLDSLDANTDPTFAGLYSEEKPVTGQDITEGDTFTKKYLATLPEDIAREDILEKERMDAFIQVYKGELLPEVNVKDELILQSATVDEKASYLETISPGQDSSVHVLTSNMVDQALADHLNAKPARMNALIEKINHNIDMLTNTPVPQDMLDLHTKNIAAHQSLLESTKLLENVNNDFVGALIGTHNIKELGPTFREIATEINQLKDDQ